MPVQIIKKEKFRSSGTKVNEDYDMYRITLDVPINEWRDIEVQSYIRENHLKLCKNRDQFYKTFNEKLDKFFDIKTGFNLVEFDKALLQTVNNKSLKGTLREKYGKEASDFVKSLL